MNERAKPLCPVCGAKLGRHTHLLKETQWYPRLHGAFHKVWTASVGQPGYVKRDWGELEEVLNEICRREHGRDILVDRLRTFLPGRYWGWDVLEAALDWLERKPPEPDCSHLNAPDPWKEGDTALCRDCGKRITYRQGAWTV